MAATAPSTVGLIRAMELADLPAVVDIERRAYAYPWSEQVFRDCVRAGYDAWVYLGAGEVRGYLLVAAAGSEAHILNLCVCPHWQRWGVGRRLMEYMLERVARSPADTVVLEVRPTNRAARRLYATLGFHEIGRRADYYPDADGREDALVLARDLYRPWHQRRAR